jgi:membrane associated rhomboid family serine protease
MLLTLLMLALLALFPIGDDNTGRTRTPYVTYALLAANVLIFVMLQGLGSNERFTLGYSVVPYEITNGRDLVGVTQGGIPQTQGPQPIYLTVLSAMFMHGSLMHLLGNMLYLWIFGDNLEDAMGHLKFLMFYLLCGLVATFAHIMTGPGSLIPSLGASGAIAGVLGGYLLMYPSRQVRVLIGYLGIVAMPALHRDWLLGRIPILQRFWAISAAAQWRWRRVHGAHRGFVAGLLLVKLFATAKSQERVAVRESQPVDYFPLGGSKS